MAASSLASSLLFLVPYSFSSSSPKTLVPNLALQTRGRVSSSSSASPHSLSLASSIKPLSFFCSNRSLAPALVRRVATSSPDLEVEELASRGEEEEPRFAPELKLFVGNLPFSVDSAELADLFSRAGTVEMVEVIFDKLTGRSRGFGFVTMSTAEEVDGAAQLFNGYELHGRPLRVNSGPPPHRDGPPVRRFRNGGNFNSANRVHVGNLSWGVDDLALQTFFSEKGKVVDAKVVCDRESGRSRGYGFVTYSCAEEVDLAISSLNGAELEGRPIRVTVAEARSRPQF